MVFADILEELKVSEKSKEPLLCDPETFRFICKLEIRRVERGSDLPVVYTGLLTLTCTDPQLQPEEVMEKFRQVLLSTLRRSDVISRWSETQFVLFFPGLNLEGAEKVMRRIVSIFKKTFQAVVVSLDCSIIPLSPWENR